MARSEKSIYIKNLACQVQRKLFSFVANRVGFVEKLVNVLVWVGLFEQKDTQAVKKFRKIRKIWVGGYIFHEDRVSVQKGGGGKNRV